MLNYKTEKILGQFQGLRLEYEKISILIRGSNMLKDKKTLILYLLDNLTMEYEKKLAILTQELLNKNCQHENILIAEKQNIITTLNSVYNAIDNIKITEGLIRDEENTSIQRT